MDLTKILTASGRKPEQITRIYHGLENCCRCGCGGKYFSRGTAGFTRAMNAMQKPSFKPLAAGAEMRAKYGMRKSEGVVHGDNYVDIPYDAEHDKCYCLYFG